MNFYENLVVLDPNLDSKSTEESIKRINDLIVKKGGEVLKTENWGRKKLAYELKKRKEGIYTLLIFKAPPLVIGELERFYKLFDPLIKFLVIKLNKKQIDKVLSDMTGAENNKDTKPVPSSKENQNV